MSKSAIEWTDETKIIDRGGRRVRIYHRIDKTRPGQQVRRQMAAIGKKWCRKCQDWLPASNVTKNGLCRKHELESYRSMYAANPHAIKARVHARKRGLDPIPAWWRQEQLERGCAYCESPAQTLDHVIPVARGGESCPGNLVPACQTCNSRKKHSDPLPWIYRMRAEFIETILIRPMGGIAALEELGDCHG